MGVVKALLKLTKDNNNLFKSSKNVSPNITGSVAFLSPKYISGDEITVFGESRFILLREFKFIVSKDDKRIESVFELKTIRPEFNIICSPSN